MPHTTAPLQHKQTHSSVIHRQPPLTIMCPFWPSSPRLAGQSGLDALCVQPEAVWPSMFNEPR